MDFENKLFSFTDQNRDFGSLAFVLFLCLLVSVLNLPVSLRLTCTRLSEENSFSSQHKILLATPTIKHNYYCETQKTVNTRNINGMLLCCKEKSQSGVRKLNRKQQRLLTPCQGGVPGRLSEFQNVSCRRFVKARQRCRKFSDIHLASSVVCRYFVWALSLLFGPCRLSEFYPDRASLLVCGFEVCLRVLNFILIGH